MSRPRGWRQREAAASKPDVLTSQQPEAEKGIFAGICEIVDRRFGRAVLSDVAAQEIYEYVLKQMIAVAIRTGRFALPPGLGVFKVVRQAPTSRRLPDQSLIQVPERTALRYTEGDTVRVALGKPDRFPMRKKPLLTGL